MSLPHHLLVGSDRHGVTRHAGELAAALGAPVLRADADRLDDLPTVGAVHVHVTDRLFGRSPAEAADRLVALAAHVPTTVTLHDLPQPSDGTGYAARRDAYRRVLAAARAWAVSSQWERTLVRRHLDPAADGLVVPLPVSTTPVRHTAPLAGPPVLGVLGWLYPGKGHAQVVDAAAALVAAGTPVQVVALGAPSPGHDDLATGLAGHAARRGVPWTLTGYLSDAELADRLARVAVGVAAHGHVSASGSMNAWLAVGRRPLVADSPYAREMAALRPGCYRLYTDLAAALAQALADAGSTRLPAGPVPWTPADAAAAYRVWWAGL